MWLCRKRRGFRASVAVAARESCNAGDVARHSPTVSTMIRISHRTTPTSSISMRHFTTVVAAATAAFTSVSLGAQTATIVYKLGTDTVAIEQYTRAGNKMSGEMVQRNGPTVGRVVYDITFGADNRPTAATSRATTAMVRRLLIHSPLHDSNSLLILPFGRMCFPTVCSVVHLQ